METFGPIVRYRFQYTLGMNIQLFYASLIEITLYALN